MKKYKPGDWCFHAFRLTQVTKTKDGKIIEVTDGAFVYSDKNLSDYCYPLEMSVKKISDKVALLEDKIRQANTNNRSTHWVLKILWLKMCENRNDNAEVERLTYQVESFAMLEIHNQNRQTYKSLNKS